MANIEITNNKTNGMVVWEPVYQDETLTAAGALTYPAGTALGRITTGAKLTHYASTPVAGAEGSEVIVAVLANDVTFAGAGDAPIRALISGRVRASDITAWNSGTPAPLAISEKEMLRDMTIIVQETEQLTSQDNQ